MSMTNRNYLTELAEAWHAPNCEVDAGGACILHTDQKEAWIDDLRAVYSEDCLSADHLNCQYDLSDEQLCKCQCHEESWARQVTQS